MNNQKGKQGDEAYYHEKMTFDSRQENWSGVFSLLLIPLFIMLVGWGVVTTFKLPARNDGSHNGIESGIGGGSSTSIKPYNVPSITITPHQTDSLEFIQ